MGRFLSRALRGAGKALEKGVESADALIDGPVTDGIKHAADTSKHTVNRVSKGLADRTAAAASNDNIISNQGGNEHMAMNNLPDNSSGSAIPVGDPVDMYIGPSVDKRKLNEMISRGVLGKGETLKAAIWGSVESSRDPLGGARSKNSSISLGVKATGLDKRSGLMGLTNRRVIFYMPKMMNRYEFEAFAIKQIDSIQFTKGMRKGRIDVTILNGNRVIKGIDNEEGRTIVDIVQEAVDSVAAQGSTPTVITQQAQQSPIDALKMKFVNGEITKEEYEEKKAILEG